MGWPQGLDPHDFLDRYWQKAPLLLPEALPADLPRLCAEELAWLASLDDVESRLVFTENLGNRTHYRLEQGPFDEQRLASLPPRDWTLLVQDVEKHLPDFRAWLEPFRFVPEWRIDDLMISFAAPGGSVGPHVDHYDVFLCQLEGTRVWRLAGAGVRPVAGTTGGLALIEAFDDPAAKRVSPGDLLYLPPGIAHWGIADSACMTLSVGMRAPNAAELRASYDREFPRAANPFPDIEDCFYEDGDLQSGEAATTCLTPAAIMRCGRLASRAGTTERELAITLGCTVTDLKAWLVPASADSRELGDLLRQAPDAIAVHGWTRVTCWQGPDELLLFANGHYLSLPGRFTETVGRLCRERLVETLSVRNTDGRALLSWLATHGVLDLEWSTE